MRIRNKTASVIWKLALLAFCTYGLLDGSGLLAGAYKAGFPHMFTNISNLFAWVYFACAAVWLIVHRDDGAAVTFAPVLKYTATISLLATMLIAHFLMFDTLVKDGVLQVHLIILHYIVPIMTLLDWALFDEKGKMPMWGPFAWMSLLLAYLAVVMVAVGVFGADMGGGTTADVSRYPYTFLDPGISGVGGVVLFCAAMLVAFVAAGYILVGLDRLLAQKRKS